MFSEFHRKFTLFIWTLLSKQETIPFIMESAHIFISSSLNTPKLCRSKRALYNYFTHTPVCVLGDKQKQKGIFCCSETSPNEGLPKQQSRLRLHSLISSDQTQILRWLDTAFRKQKCLTCPLIILSHFVL